MKGAQDCFRFVCRQLGDGQPKRGNTTILEAVVHEFEKLLCVEIDRAGYLQRWRFTGDNVVAIRAGLEEEAAVLDKRGDARIAQRILSIRCRSMNRRDRKLPSKYRPNRDA